MREHEFARAGPVDTPGLDEITVAIELYDARIPVAVCHKDIAVLRECDISRFAEQPIGLTAIISPTKYEQHLPRRAQLQHRVVGIVRGPDVIVRINAQSMRVIKQSLAEAAYVATVFVEL